MIFLPKSVCAVINAAAKPGSTSRYSLEAVKITARPDGGYRIEATDGRKALIVQEGYYEPNARDIAREDLAWQVAEPDPAEEALVPAKALADAFKLVGKGERLFVRIEKRRAIFVGGDTVMQTPTCEHRFPNIDQVIPDKAPVAQFSVLPDVWVDTFKAFHAMAPGRAITMCLYPDNVKDGLFENAMGASVQTADGLLIDCVMMPTCGIREKFKADLARAEKEKEEARHLKAIAAVSDDQAHDDDEDEDDDAPAQRWRPEQALKLVADDIERLRKIDIDRLIESIDTYDHAEEMVCFIGQYRPELGETAIEAMKSSWIVEEEAEEELREVIATAVEAAK